MFLPLIVATERTRDEELSGFIVFGQFTFKSCFVVRLEGKRSGKSEKDTVCQSVSASVSRSAVSWVLLSSPQIHKVHNRLRHKSTRPNQKNSFTNYMEKLVPITEIPFSRCPPTECTKEALC